MKRAAALTAIAAAVAACQVIAGIERVEKVAPSSEDGGASAAPDGAIPADDPCAHMLPPGTPDKDDDPLTKIEPFFLAVRTIDVSPKEDGGTAYRGYDLDAVCTCDVRPKTIHDGSSSCTKTTTVDAGLCDSPNGIDAKGSELFDTVARNLTAVPSLNDTANGDIDGGRRTILMYLSDWNGLANDREVSFGVVIGDGIKDPRGCANEGPDDKGNFPPSWCGKDRWTYREDSTSPGPAGALPKMVAMGFVRDFQLVLTMSSPIRLYFGSAELDLGSPIVAGRLTPIASGGWRLSGLLAGRFAANDLLQAAGQLKLGGDESNRVCSQAPLMAFATSLFCSSVDIRSSVALDFQETPCNALSTSIAFTAEPATLGDVSDGADDEVNDCAPTGPDDPRYVCPR